MKNTVYYLVVAVVCLSSVFSETCCASDNSFGVKAGFNLSNIYGEDAGNTSQLPGLMAGCYATLNILSSLNIQPEVCFSQKGWEVTVNNSYISYYCKSRINYLEVPILARLSFGDPTKVFILAGPYFAARVGSSAEITINNQTSEDDFNGAITSTDNGLVFGLGAKLKNRITIEARYSPGLKSIDKSALSLEYKNSSFYLLVGYDIL